MYSQGNFLNFANLNQRWENLFSSNQLEDAEFQKLYKETLPMILSFYAIDNPEVVKLLRMLGNVKFSDPDIKESIDDLGTIEKWNAVMPLTMLSGRLISRSCKALQPSEKRFLFEDDNVIQARIESLMNLFLTNNSENVSQMILNALETYKKILICETSMQNKVTGQTLENLIKSLLIITCHRKDYDHLKSLIKYFPLHRKVQFIISETNAPITKPHVKRCRLFVCAAIAQDLLLSEFSRPIEEQNIESLNLYVNIIVDLALNHDDVNRKLERIFLCANDMNVISDYYYLVANILRFKMPNKNESLVIKLISIGISHDLSRLEQIKYTKENGVMKYSEEDFIKCYRRMFAALLTLGFIVPDYSIRRLCVQAAAVCEPEEKVCKEIVDFLPRFDVKVKAESVEMQVALRHLREQLEAFQSAIKSNVNLSKTWTITSALCYENLDFLYRRKTLSDDLQPLEYPGVEKYLKKMPQNEEAEEPSEEKKPIIMEKVLEECKILNESLSQRLKTIKNPFRVPNDPSVVPPTPQEIKAVILKAVRTSPDFELLNINEIFMKLPEPFQKLKSYQFYFFAKNKEQMKRNKPNLFFDFDVTQETKASVMEMYQEGVIRVHDLCCQGLNIFDIENVMLFAILEKKCLYMAQEFVDFNKNQMTRNQHQLAFFYLIARPLPQFALLCRTVNIGFTSTSMLDFCVDHYVFDATPCRYAYKKKGEDGAVIEGPESLPIVPEDPAKVKPPRKVAASKMVRPPQQKVIKQNLTPPGTPRPSHKAKRPPPVDINAGKDSFNASQEILDVFLLMANELSKIIQEKVEIDLRQMTNPHSEHNVHFTYETTTELTVNVTSMRNHKLQQLLTKDISLPARIHGGLNVCFEITDSIFYDENNLPHIKTTKLPKISGSITFDHMSHQIKLMDIQCAVNGIRSGFKFSMRGGSRSYEKKLKEERMQRESEGTADDAMLKLLKSTPINAAINPPTNVATNPPTFPNPNPPQQQNGELLSVKVEPEDPQTPQNFQTSKSVIVQHQSPQRQTPIQVVNPMVTSSAYYPVPQNLPSPTIAKIPTSLVQQVQTFSDGQMMTHMPRFSPQHFNSSVEAPVSHQQSAASQMQTVTVPAGQQQMMVDSGSHQQMVVDSGGYEQAMMAPGNQQQEMDVPRAQQPVPNSHQHTGMPVIHQQASVPVTYHQTHASHYQDYQQAPSSHHHDQMSHQQVNQHPSQVNSIPHPVNNQSPVSRESTKNQTNFQGNQQSPMGQQQTMNHQQQSPVNPQHFTTTSQYSPVISQPSMISQKSPLTQQSPLIPQQSPSMPQQSPSMLQQSPSMPQQSSVISQPSPVRQQYAVNQQSMLAQGQSQISPVHQQHNQQQTCHQIPQSHQQPVNGSLNYHQTFTTDIHQQHPPESSVIVSPKTEKCKIISVEGLPKMSFSGPLIVDFPVNSNTQVKMEVDDSEESDEIDFEAQLPVAQVVVKPETAKKSNIESDILDIDKTTREFDEYTRKIDGMSKRIDVKAKNIDDPSINIDLTSKNIDEAPVEEQTPPTSPPPLHYPKNEVKKTKHLINPFSKNVKVPGVVRKDFPSPLIKKQMMAERILKNTPPKEPDVIDLTDEGFDLTDSPPPKRFHQDADPLAINFVDINEVESSGIDNQLSRDYNRVKKKVGMRMGPKRLRDDERRNRKIKVFLVDVMKQMKETCFRQHMQVKLKEVDPKIPKKYKMYSSSRKDVCLTNLHDKEEPYINPDTVVESPHDTTFQIVYQSSVSYQPLLTNANNQCNDKFSCNLNNANHVNNRASDKFLGRVDLGKSFDTNSNRLNFTKNLKNVRKFLRWSPKVNNDAIIDECLKNDEKKELSHEIPGLNSFEFFQLPKRSLAVNVVHVMKNGSVGEGEKDQGSELQGEGTNGESSTSTHVQKIGQTSINETKTIQTSFGSIIKNTYPPATLSTRTVVNDTSKKESQSLKKVHNHEVKIVAGSANSSQPRNQTLINMLTQQVMLPTNSNRHFIITNSPTKCDNNVTTVSSSLPKKVIATPGQSQLVQILNSPPSNFTMKSAPNVTVAPQNNAAFKTELPTAAKQQGIVQFICKTDGKIIHLTPICSGGTGGTSKKITYKVDTTGAKGPTILHHANQQIIINNQLKKTDNQNILTIIQKQDDKDKPTSPISTRSIYEETYAKFIQTSSTSSGKSTDMGLLTISSSPMNTPITSCTSSPVIQKIGKTVIQSSGQALPKFNQAFGKTIFTEVKGKKEVVATRVETKPVTKITRTVSEIKSTDAGTLLSLIDGDGSEKQLPTLQSNLLYARPIGNGKLLASNSNNVLLTALRGNNTQNNVRIITSVSETSTRGNSNAIVAPMRISVPIQIPKLINTSVRPQTPGSFRQQIVIATTPTRMPTNQGSKLESLLMTSQVKQEIPEEPKQKKVDHSTLEQLREFDMVLEQVLERSSSEVTATSMSSPPTPDSPKKQLLAEAKMKMNSVTITSISPSESPKPGSSSSGVKAAPKVQEDEHTAQRILDILANYKEQVRNSPDLNNKPAPRRRANPPTNPPAAKRKKIVVSSSGSMKSSKQFGSTSDMMTDTMGSEEDSSCGMGSGVASTGSMNNSPQPQDIDDQTDVSMDNNFYNEDMKRETALSPQSSSSSVATSPSHNKFPVSRRLILTEAKPEPKNIVITNAPQQPTSSLGTTIERFAAQGSTAAVLMPGNYLLPMNVLKSGQLAILSSNNGQKIIAVPTNQLQQSGTSIILQRYLNQSNDKTVLSPTESAFKAIRPTVAYKTSPPTPSNTLYIRPIPSVEKTVISSQVKQEDEVKESKFVSDKTLITEIIQQQQMSTHQHPQQNFMIKLNEHQPSDPRSSSSIMFVPNSPSTSQDPPKIKIEEIDYDDYMKEDAIDLLHEGEPMQKSPMLNTKIEADDNTNSNHAGYEDTVVKLESDQTQKFQQFPIILNKASNAQGSKNIKGFLIDPTNKIVMYNDRRPTTIEKDEFFNQKSFSEECADLGVDEPIASDLFPEADLLFDSGSPKFDQISSDNAMHIKKELENGEVLLEMNYNHNMETESWLNFDTEEELVDDSPHGDDDRGDGGGHSGDYF